VRYEPHISDKSRCSEGSPFSVSKMVCLFSSSHRFICSFVYTCRWVVFVNNPVAWLKDDCSSNQGRAEIWWCLGKLLDCMPLLNSSVEECEKRRQQAKTNVDKTSFEKIKINPCSVLVALQYEEASTYSILIF